MKKKRPHRHQRVIIPASLYYEWMLMSDVNECLFSVGEDVLSAKSYADAWRAQLYKSSAELYAAGEKEEDRLCDESLSVKARTEAGMRATRKFWEAKVAARRVGKRK